jgi:hypothetical protein
MLIPQQKKFYTNIVDQSCFLCRTSRAFCWAIKLLQRSYHSKVIHTLDNFSGSETGAGSQMFFISTTKPWSKEANICQKFIFGETWYSSYLESGVKFEVTCYASSLTLTSRAQKHLVNILDVQIPCSRLDNLEVKRHAYSTTVPWALSQKGKMDIFFLTAWTCMYKWPKPMKVTLAQFFSAKQNS